MPIYLNGVRYSVGKISTTGDTLPILQMKWVDPSEITQQVRADDGYDGLGRVTVNAISKSYVGSGVRRITEDDLEPGDGVLLIPSGYYPEDISVEVTSGSTSYSVVPKTETWQHNTYVTISVDIGSDGSISAYKSAGGGTADNMVICYPQSDTYVASSEITKIPFPNTPGEYTIPITVWWDNQNGAHNDHNNHTLTYTVVAKSGGNSVDIQSLSITSNGTYTAPEGVAYNPVTVNIPSQNIITLNATSNGTYNPGNGNAYGTVTVNVPEKKNVQGYLGMKSVSTTSYSSTGVSLTVGKTGTYRVSWMGVRNTNSGTNGSQLYINNASYGTAQTSFTNTYAQNVVLNNVSLTAGQTVEVRARARSTSYYMMVGNLIIEEV